MISAKKDSVFRKVNCIGYGEDQIAEIGWTHSGITAELIDLIGGSFYE